jgi:hypothetical protein
MDPAVFGYAHPSYAASLSEFGQPLLLARSGGFLLRRRIAGADADDAMGCYPLFACANWRALCDDLDGLDGLVSVTLVSDPFGEYDRALLRRGFPDLAVPFKEHFALDLGTSPFEVISRDHRRDVRASLRKVRVELCDRPWDWTDTWWELYRDLAARHGLRGIRAFSRQAFAVQLATPGIVVFRATAGDRVVGMHLWFQAGDVCHSHLNACSAEGRRLRAAFAMHWTAIEHFRERVRWLNLGGGAGTQTTGDDGLTRFKRGWSNATRHAYLCGRILDRSRYEALAGARWRADDDDYFPAYRRGEFE